MSRHQLPEDLDAERALLSTICAPGAEKAAHLVVPGLVREDFMHPSHQAILEGLRVLVRDGVEPGPITLRDQLDRMGNLSRVGGYAGLVEILSGEEVSHPEVLVATLQRHRRRRELMRLAAQLHRQASDTSEDPDEVVSAGQAELARIARDGRQEESESWMEILHAMSAGEAFRRPGLERGGWWGIPSLDDEVPIPAGEYTTLGARPGVGKTALMTQIACETARRGIRPLVITMELPRPTMRARIASYLAQVSVPTLKAAAYTDRHTRIVGSQAHLLEIGRTSDRPAGTPWARLEALIRYEVAAHGVGMVLIDQFDKIGRPPVQRGSSEAYAFAAVSQGLMEVTKDLNIGLVLLCQLKGDAQDREPRLDDHADSDRPGKDGGVVVHLWRDKNDVTHAKVHKNRDGVVGKRFDLDFDGRIQRFRENTKTTDDPGPEAPGLPYGQEPVI